MLRQFWRTLIALAATAALYSTVSWVYLQRSHVAAQGPVTGLQLVSFPSGFPSIWDIVRSNAAVSGWILLAVFLVHVLLTGGFLGTLVRVNSLQATAVSTFLADAARSFWRLLFWNLLWVALSFLAVGLTGVMRPLGVIFAILLLLVRFLFLFAEVALVCEQQARLGAVLRMAIQTMVEELVRMVPVAVAIVLLTGLGLSLAATGSPIRLLLTALAYTSAMTWLSHLVVARYVVFSAWKARTGATAATS